MTAYIGSRFLLENGFFRISCPPCKDWQKLPQAQWGPVVAGIVFVLYNFHREHSPALCGHHAFGFTKMNLQITEIEAFDYIEITIHLIDGMTSIIHRFLKDFHWKLDGYYWI